MNHAAKLLNRQVLLCSMKSYQTKVIGLVLFYTHVANTSEHELLRDVLTHEPSTLAYTTAAISKWRLPKKSRIRLATFHAKCKLLSSNKSCL